MRMALVFCLLTVACGGEDFAQRPSDPEPDACARIRAAIDAIPAVDNHEHLRLPETLPFWDLTPDGKKMTLHSVWAASYLPYITDIPPWPADRSFATWWRSARDGFGHTRAAGFYRYLLPTFRDLYGVDFDRITDDQAAALNERIQKSYQDPDWVRHVIVDRANIEFLIVDPFWSPLYPPTDFPFSAPLLNVSSLITGSHPAQAPDARSNPYDYARRIGAEIRSFDDYLRVVKAIVSRAAETGAVGMKSTQAYTRTLRFENVTRDRATAAFGRPPAEVTPEQQKDFEDYMMWRLCELSALHDLPIQIHTGRGRPDGSNPMLLINLVVGNPDTKFVLLHGGYPWIDDMAALAQTHRNVWVDASWLPTLSYTTAKRAFLEWLDCLPADRILWGGDSVYAEGIYGAADLTRRCLAEALEERVLAGELREEDALKIARMILRDNAIALYPRLRKRMGK